MLVNSTEKDIFLLSDSCIYNQFNEMNLMKNKRI